jgi:hypothetical protein
VGFRITVSKWIVIVQLLKGEIPERALFVRCSQTHQRLSPCLATPPPPRAPRDLTVWASGGEG